MMTPPHRTLMFAHVRMFACGRQGQVGAGFGFGMQGRDSAGMDRRLALSTAIL
jgi:hypothetical protein